MRELRIDSHKLMYHPERVADWLNKKTVYPVYMEISPTASCNLRCVFCAFDYVDYPKRHLETARLKQTLDELSSLGVKSVMYAGEGEPFLHSDMPELLVHTKKCGIDAAVATNATMLTPEVSNACLGALSWMRVSINAGTPKGYALVHKASENMFEKVLHNLSYAVELKRKNNLECRIGAQIVLIRPNMDEVVPLAERLRKIGLDYMTIKPFIPHPLSLTGWSETYDPEELRKIHEQLLPFETDRFKIIFRRHGFEKLSHGKRRYRSCHGVHFFAEIVSDGEVYSCGPFLGVPEHSYGNIYKNTFKEIWAGDQRKRVLEHIAALDVDGCMSNCRLDEVNFYLWELLNPPEHVNFI